MTDHHSYYGTNKDPTLMHRVDGSGIQEYTKSSVFLSVFQRWKPARKWRFTVETRMVEYKNMSGKGWVSLTGLDGATATHQIYAFDTVQALESEVRAAGVVVEPKYPGSWG